jgi:hypothetical protein
VDTATQQPTQFRPNFEQTKIRDVNDKVAICLFGDIELAYLNENNFICCAYLCKVLNPDKFKTMMVKEFFELKTTQ